MMGLLDIINKLPTASEFKGAVGEYITEYFSKITTDAKVIRDIVINTEDGETTQIDLVLIDSKGISVVEVKNYSENAVIYGDGKKSNWYYYLGNKKYDIYSPLKQNKNHIKYLKNFLADFGEIPFYNIVVILCKDFKIKNINENINNPDTFICSSMPTLKKGMNILFQNKEDILSDAYKEEIYNYILNNQNRGREERIKHKNTVAEKKQHQEELIKQNVCPYCGKSLVIRNGKYGKFYGCTGYPECRFVKKL